MTPSSWTIHCNDSQTEASALFTISLLMKVIRRSRSREGPERRLSVPFPHGVRAHPSASMVSPVNSGKPRCLEFPWRLQ